ncbi:hypothetical protein KAR91_26060 [Candidatus Pacearchaeota archaeon]|nr:hypothetical protein [Candidatus Pacearchaeota archaeon]
MDFYKPTLQTKFNGDGNCLSAVIATLFDTDISVIPVFADNEKNWVAELSAWMVQNFGKYVVPVGMAKMSDTSLFGGSLLITVINSSNPDVERHAVITKGCRVVFDPMIGEVDRMLKKSEDPIFMVIGDVRKR